MERQQFANQLPEMYAAVVLVGLIGYFDERRASRPSSAGRSSGRARSDRCNDDIATAPPRGHRARRARLHRRPLRLGGLGTSRGLVPRADVRARWRSRRGRSGRPRSSCRRPAASLKRLAVGFVIAAAIGIGLGLLVGASQQAQANAGAVPRAPAGCPGDRHRAGRDRHPWPRRRAARRRHRVRPLFSDPRQHCRRRAAVPPEVRDTARCSTSAAWSGSSGSISRRHCRRSWPGCASRCRSASILVVVSEFVGEGNGLGHYLTVQQSTFAFRRCTPASSSSGFLGYS